MTARCAQYMSTLAQKQPTIAQESPHYNLIFEVFKPMSSRYLKVTDGQTDGKYTVASPLGKNRNTKYRRYYRYRRYFKLKLSVYCRVKQVNGITTAKEITKT